MKCVSDHDTGMTHPHWDMETEGSSSEEDGVGGKNLSFLERGDSEVWSVVVY